MAHRQRYDRDVSRAASQGADQVPTAASETPELSVAYRLHASESIATLWTDEQRGLSDEEARARLARYGANELAAEKPMRAWRRFLSQFQDVLVILLLIATAISAGLWIMERDAALPYEAIAILAVVLLNATMRKGKRISYSGFYKAWQRAVGSARVARVPHDFRRTAIRNLERDGVPRSVAMAMVGQKTEEVYRRYAIVDEAMIREAAVKMNRGAKVRRTTAQRTAQSDQATADR
jgi:cation transport ATPase-like protein/integrase-like protein